MKKKLHLSIWMLGGLCASFLLLGARSPYRGETWKVIGWNDLGMHCMDSDYSVFSILPPFNTIHAQVVDPKGKLVQSATGIKVTYEAIADPSGSINRSSRGKTNYWDHAKELYGGSSTPDTGLTGNHMPGSGNQPQPMKYDSKSGTFVAEGIPLTPFDDAGRKRYYPLMRIVVRDGIGNLLASTQTVLPVSDEMDCSLCHGSGAGAAAKPSAGWVFDSDFSRDYRLNILRLHDEKHAKDTRYGAALKAAGYQAKGLYATVTTKGQSILCARCHGSNALPGTGQKGLTSLTEAIHSFHAKVKDPINNMTLDSSRNRASCYRCHPGSATRCLRGAMGGAVATDGSLAMQCQNCHGSMSKVGASTRTGWLQEPSCQNCHTGTAVKNNGQIRFADAFDASGKLRQPVDRTFATNANVPGPGFDLYRFSRGHKGIQCEACHGSTHAVFPSIHGNDNLQNQGLQGHEGTLSRCDACHKQMPTSFGKGPHGMHPIGAVGLDKHEDVAEKQGVESCKACHGTNLRGTVLSRSFSDQTLSTKFGNKSFFRGAIVSCYACHNGPKSEHKNPNRSAVASPGKITVGSKPVAITLQASDPDKDPLVYRIVSQPAHGRVALKGNQAVYHPDPVFAGTDTFSFAAYDGSIDSNLAKVTVTRLADSREYGRGYPGKGGSIPRLRAAGRPILGAALRLDLDNSSGAASAFVMLLSGEPADRSTPFGGQILVQPAVILGLALPAAGSKLLWQIPNQPSLLGSGLLLQAVQYDPSARFLFSFTPGLELRMGR